MTKAFIKLFAVCLVLTSHTIGAVPEQTPVPGGIALLALSNFEPGTVVRFNDERAAVLSYEDTWIALGGISLQAKPGEEVKFSVLYKNGNTLNKTIKIIDKQYPVQHLKIKNKRQVNPNAEDLKRIEAESKRKTKAKTHWSDTIPSYDFIWPVDGEISSAFGLRRFFNDQERKQHSGLDIAADKGTPVLATATGTVIDTGNFFFSGNMIYIDHGQGIISLYAHLDRINVKPGETVRQGDTIGFVGHTGRVTGPHLHFAVLANKTLIDPLYILLNKK